MNRQVIAIARVLGIVSFIFGGLFAYGYYEEYPARSFCNNVPDESTPSYVVTSAKQKGLPVFDVMNDENKIVVLNHKSPFFRIACEVKFHGDRITSKGIVGAD